MREITLTDIENVIKDIFSEEDLELYKPIGNGLYKIQNELICNQKGLEEYLKMLRDSV